MASFRTLPFTFLLLNVLSVIQAGDDCLSCPKPNIAELGKGIVIKCKSNAPIESMAMSFCPLKGDCYSAKGVIYQHNSTLTDGETTLEFHSNMASLSINQIKISHEGNYKIDYVGENGMNSLNIFLGVFAPYTAPQIMEQEGNVTCTASGGYPEEKLYWVSKAGTKLTHKSTYQSVKNEDGSFSLSNTLQLDSAPSETEFCCIFNNTRVPNRQPVSECKILGNVNTSMFKAEKTTPNKTGIIIAITITILLACIVMWWIARRKNDLHQETKSQKKTTVNHIYTVVNTAWLSEYRLSEA